MLAQISQDPFSKARCFHVVPVMIGMTRPFMNEAKWGKSQLALWSARKPCQHINRGRKPIKFRVRIRVRYDKDMATTSLDGAEKTDSHPVKVAGADSMISTRRAAAKTAEIKRKEEEAAKEKSSIGKTKDNQIVSLA